MVNKIFFSTILSFGFIFSMLFAASRLQQLKNFFSGATKKVRIEYIQKKLALLKKTLEDFRQCTIGKKECTRQQIQAIRITILGIIAVLLTAGFSVYKLYQYKTVGGYAGLVKSDLQSFFNRVRRNINAPQLDTLRFDMSRLQRLENMIRNAQLSEKEKDHLYRTIHDLFPMSQNVFSALLGALKQTGNIQFYYSDLKKTYKDNFENLGTIFSFTTDTVYTFLGTSQEAARQMTVSAINDLIDQKIQQLHETGHYQAKDINSLKRQLGYLFQSAFQKSEYDAFLQGPKELEKIRLDVTEEQKKRIEDMMHYLTTQVIASLDTIQQFLEGKEVLVVN